MAVASGLKAWLVAAERVPFNSDEAIVALMARHILQGARPFFFYGQSYMGSLDAFLAAAGFSLFGQEVWVIRLVQGLLYLGTLGTTVLLGRRIFGSWGVGITAGWLLAIPTVNVTLYTTASLGGYGEALLIGNLVLLVGFRIADELKEKPQGTWRLESLRLRSLLLWALWGFLAGLGLWVFGMTLVYTIPVGVYLGGRVWRGLAIRDQGLAIRDRGLAIRDQGLVNFVKTLPSLVLHSGVLLPIGLAFVGAVVGSAPWWVYAAQNGFGGLIGELGGGAIAGVERLPWLGQVGQHVSNIILLGISVIFGMRPPWDVGWLGLPLLPFVLIFWMAVLAFIFLRRKQRPGDRGAQAVLVGMMATLLAGLVFTPFGSDPSGRYFLPLAVPLALFAAAMIKSIRAERGMWPYGLVALVLAYNLWGTLQSAQRYPPGITTQFYAPTRVDHRYDQALIEFLQREGERRGYGNYWLTYPLAFHSREELIYTPRLPYHLDFRYAERDSRYPAYDVAVAQAERVAYITSFHPALEKYLREQFTGLGVAWEEAQVGDYQVFYRLSRAVRPEEIGLGKTRHEGVRP